MGMETHNKYKPTHGGYPREQDDLHCDDCTIDKMAQRHAEVCDQKDTAEERVRVQIILLNAQTAQLKERRKRIVDLKARVDYVEAEWVTQEARVSDLEAELSRRKVEIALLEERLNPKPKWQEGVIVVDKKRAVMSEEKGPYWFWYKNREDEWPGIMYKGSISYFEIDYIYQPMEGKTRPPQPKPLS